jgi:prepilin-type N-terminal cleavage/methylation domain-containing protein
MMSNAGQQRGFTLIEVLIAATILFATLAVVSDSYRANLNSSRRAEIVTRMLTPLPMVVSSVQNQLRENPIDRLSGSGSALGVVYRYEAVSTLFEPPPPNLDADTGEVENYPPRFRLYDVNLTLELEGQSREYVYQELAWLPMRKPW